jgi:hypothetical protein
MKFVNANQLHGKSRWKISSDWIFPQEKSNLADVGRGIRMGSALEMAELLFGHGLGRGTGCFPFEGAAHQVTRSQAHRKR